MEGISAFVPLILVIAIIFTCKKMGWLKKTSIPSVSPSSLKSPILGAVLSLVMPGLGQFYIGEISKGVCYIILYFFGVCSIITASNNEPGPVLIGSIWSIVVLFHSVLNAHQLASAMNKLLMKKCPFCAEMIRKEAVTCRYCGRSVKKQDQRMDTTHTLSAKDWLEEGHKLYSSGRYAEAIDAFDTAIGLNSNYPIAYHNRGIVYHKLGNHKQCVNDFKAAAKLGHKKAQQFLRSKGILW